MRDLLVSSASITGGLALLATAVMVSAQPRVTNYETAGNLAVTSTVGCIPLERVKRSYTPADLLAGMAKCLDADRTADAIGLFAIAGVYGQFDTYRVADRSAHQAISVLQMRALDGRSEADRKGFFAQIGRVLDDPKSLKALCRRIERVGPPTYFPKYMIQHGMGAFTGNGGDALVAGFNPKLAYPKAMESTLNCKAKRR